MPVAEPVTSATLRSLSFISRLLFPLQAFRSPVARFQVVFVKLLFLRPSRRCVVVNPTNDRGQRHENRLHSPSCFQPEHCPPVVEEIEFNITATAKFLESSLLRAVGLRPPSLDNGLICVQKTIPTISDKGERIFPISLKVIEEDAADAAALTSMREKKILVAPAFQPGVV